MLASKKPQNHEIVYLESDINYTIFHLVDGKKLMSSTTLKRHAANQYLSDFLRVNKSYLLNPNFIQSITKTGKYATISMKNGKKIGVSRRKMNVIQDFNKNL